MLIHIDIKSFRLLRVNINVLFACYTISVLIVHWAITYSHEHIAIEYEANDSENDQTSKKISLIYEM